MKTFSRIILYFAAIAVLSWFLPWIYALAFPAPANSPFCSFSPVNNKWVVTRSVPGEKPSITVVDSILPDGSTITTTISKEQRDSLVPQLFYKELLAHDRLPDTIAGKEVNTHQLRTHELMLNSSPRNIVKRQPGVWMMMESMPERVELTDASQVFRFQAKGGIEFIDMATNQVNQSRSKRFTATMGKRGFSFPARDLSANVTSRKPYDEGYLMIDSKGKLFHVKQQAGRPYIASIEMPQGLEASKAFIIEENDLSILGFVTDTLNNLYLIERDGYRVVPLQVGKIDPRKENMLIMGNLFNITMRFSGDGVSRWRAVQRTADGYKPAESLDFNQPATTTGKISEYLFPYTLAYASNADFLAYPRINNISLNAIYLNIVLALLLAIAWKRRKDAWLIGGCTATLLFGIFAFIPFILIKD